MVAIEISGLTKRYGEVLANDGVSFSVAEGEVFGYLGPNGAGKTTTIRTLMGLQSPTSGTATVLGADVRDEAALVEARERVGYLPANPQFDGDATGAQVLDLHGSIKGGSRRGELLDLFDVPTERAIRGYSTGQVRKLGLVLTFMHDPDLAVMDEPTAGLDPLMQQRFNEFLREERRAGTTVFLSSHVLSEVRRVCDRVGIVRDGRIVTVESVADLMGRSGKFVRLRVAGDVTAGGIDLDGVHDLSVRSVDGDRALAAVPAGPGGDAEAGSTGPAGEARVPAGGGSPPDEGGSPGTDGVAGEAVTELTFTYTGEFDALVEFLAGYHVLELDVEEAPLERVFMRFYGDDAGEADPVGTDADPAGEAAGDDDGPGDGDAADPAAGAASGGEP